jgi:hypothetical protein
MEKLFIPTSCIFPVSQTNFPSLHKLFPGLVKEWKFKYGLFPFLKVLIYYIKKYKKNDGHN